LIETDRAAIENYLKSHDIEWIEDSTNRERDYLRNRIRLDLLPGLSEYNPKIKETLARTADILRLEEDFISRAKRVGHARSEKVEIGSVALKETFHGLPMLGERCLPEVICHAGLRCCPHRLSHRR
ncbi:MAG: hypothetical protein J0L97_06335, partial [Alphaproteobacteria bacterium]|nr:hypothetical protein [Alphaproteobacteria bacterium]